MASLILGAAGAAIGGEFFAAGMFGMSGASIGWSLGSALGSALFQPNLPDINGPTMSDTSVQSNTYGNMREIRYGTNRMVCRNIIWSTKRIPTEHTETSGGKGPPSQSVTTTSYSVSFAVALGECGPAGIAGVRKLWLNKNLVRDWSSTNTGFTGDDGNIRVYSGADTQLPSALMEAHLGVGNVPAYRRTPYIEFEDLQLAPYSNQMPLVEAEVVEIGTWAAGTTKVLDNSAGYYYMIEHPYIQGVMLALWENPSTHASELHVIDYVDNTIQIVALGHSTMGYMCYVPTTDEFWIATGVDATINNPQPVAVAVSAQTYQITRNIMINEPGTSNTFGASYCDHPVYDPTLDAVWFFCNTTSPTGGINVVDVQTGNYITNAINIGSITPWFTSSNFAFGNGKLVLGTFYGNLLIFSDRQYLAIIPTATAAAYNIYYDSLRNRFFWYYDTGKVRTIDAATLVVTEFTNTLSVSAPGAVMGYHAAYDKVFIFTPGGANYQLQQLNAETFAVENTWNIAYNIDPSTGIVQCPLTPEYVGWIGNNPELFPLVPRLTPNTSYLYQAVADICGKVDLAAGDIEVSQLIDELPGYVIDRQMTARAAIETLQPAFYFDAVESD